MTTSVDHVAITVSDFKKSKDFYIATLKPLGLGVVADFGEAIGMGDGAPCFWVSGGTPGHAHLAFKVGKRKQVDDFHAAALANGGKDNGKPGIRSHYHQNYYAAFIHDPDGHNIEAVCHDAE